MKARKYQVFARNWWKYDGTKDAMGRRNIVPGPGRKTVIGYAETEEAARDMCRVWNANHKPGPLSRKAEYTSSY
jgi:hypothetical protein